MASGLLIPPTGCSNAQPSVSASAESGQTQPHTQGEAFSVLLKDAVKNTENESAPTRSEVGRPIEPVPVVAIGDQVTGAPLTGIVVVSVSQVSDGQKAPIKDAKAESVSTADTSAGVTPNPNPILTQNLGLTPTPNTNSPASILQNIESTPLLPQGMTVAVPPDDGTPGHEAAATNPSQPKTTDTSSTSLPQPALDLDISNEISTIQLNVPTTNKPAIRNGHVALTHVGPILEQPSDASSSSGLRPPNSLNPDQGSPPNMENQGITNLLSSSQGQVQGNGVVPTLVRPATDIRPAVIIQEQGDHETTLLSQSLSVRAIEESGGEQGSLGDPMQGDGDGEGGRVQFNAGGTPESMARSNQFPFFTDQLISARQIQLPQATGSPVAMSTTDHLKLTQSLLGGEHSGTMTSATSGLAQTVHLELPSHDSGPLNVRISILDQTVHTQFTTDRSELGAMLMVRQDQLQQNLIKSGLELGQFQVHVNQEGRQDALPDRQFRRNDGTPEQQLASQDHHRQAHDQERPTHRPMRTLSLFA